MRRVVLGLMLIPGVLAGAYMASHGGRVAVASPVESRASARLTRMLQGDFEAPASGNGEGRVGAVARKVCRLDAPALGEHVLYAEERFVRGSGRPISQRVYVVEAEGRHGARVREFELNDPGGARGLCDDPSNAHLGPDDVSERAGCAVSAVWRVDHFEGTTAGDACASVLNGATHAKRDLVVSENEVAVRERGFDEGGAAVWGHLSAPMRFARAER
jgi:hypothetical protein